MTVTRERFEDRLLTELRAVVSANPAPAPVRATTRTPARRPIAIGGTLAGVGAGAVAISLAMAGGASPAYAVSDHDGKVSVSISSLQDAAGLKRELAAVGVTSVVDYLPAGKTCKQPRISHTGQATGAINQLNVGRRSDGATTFTFDAGQIGDGTLVIEASGDDTSNSLSVRVADGTVAPCTPVEGTPPADGGPGAGTQMSTEDGRIGGSAVKAD